MLCNRGYTFASRFLSDGQALIEVSEFVVDFHSLGAAAVSCEAHVERDGVALGKCKGFWEIIFRGGYLGVLPLRNAGRDFPVVVILRGELAGGGVQHGDRRVAGSIRHLMCW